MVLKKHQKLLLLSAFLLCVTGCGKTEELKKKNTVEKETVNITWQSSGESIHVAQEEVLFNPGDMIPIMTDGEVKGYLKINWVQRLGIWDFCNERAVTAGVHESFTINMNVDFSDNIKAGQMMVVTVEPYLVDSDGNPKGTACIVGWSGFSSTAQLYDKNKSENIEIGVQPEVLNTDGLLIKLVVADSNGIQYDDILLDNSFLSQAISGPSIITGEETTIHSINGGAFTVGVNNVNQEVHPLVDENGFSDEEASFYDFNYTVAYDAEPTNDREVLMFDSNNGNVLKGQMLMYVTSDVDGTKLYDSCYEAQRLRYSNLEDTFRYVTEEFIDIPIGKKVTASLNRKVPISTGKPDYVRVHFEFPEEAAARTLEEMIQYDGRFIVFQQKIVERPLEIYEEYYGEGE